MLGTCLLLMPTVKRQVLSSPPKPETMERSREDEEEGEAVLGPG